jgi:hypothetical protein
MSLTSLVPYRDCAMTPGTFESASSTPNPLIARSSGAVILDTARGVVIIDEALRVAVTVIPGSAITVSRGGGL